MIEHGADAAKTALLLARALAARTAGAVQTATEKAAAAAGNVGTGVSETVRTPFVPLGGRIPGAPRFVPVGDLPTTNTPRFVPLTPDGTAARQPVVINDLSAAAATPTEAPADPRDIIRRSNARRDKERAQRRDAPKAGPVEIDQKTEELLRAGDKAGIPMSVGGSVSGGGDGGGDTTERSEPAGSERKEVEGAQQDQPSSEGSRSAGGPAHEAPQDANDTHRAGPGAGGPNDNTQSVIIRGGGTPGGTGTESGTGAGTGGGNPTGTAGSHQEGGQGTNKVTHITDAGSDTFQGSTFTTNTDKNNNTTASGDAQPVSDAGHRPPGDPPPGPDAQANSGPTTDGPSNEQVHHRDNQENEFTVVGGPEDVIFSNNPDGSVTEIRGDGTVRKLDDQAAAAHQAAQRAMDQAYQGMATGNTTVVNNGVVTDGPEVHDGEMITKVSGEGNTVVQERHGPQTPSGPTGEGPFTAGPDGVVPPGGEAPSGGPTPDGPGPAADTTGQAGAPEAAADSTPGGPGEPPTDTTAQAADQPPPRSTVTDYARQSYDTNYNDAGRTPEQQRVQAEFDAAGERLNAANAPGNNIDRTEYRRIVEEYERAQEKLRYGEAVSEKHDAYDAAAARLRDANAHRRDVSREQYRAIADDLQRTMYDYTDALREGDEAYDEAMRRGWGGSDWNPQPAAPRPSGPDTSAQTAGSDATATINRPDAGPSPDAAPTDPAGGSATDTEPSAQRSTGTPQPGANLNISIGEVSAELADQLGPEGLAINGLTGGASLAGRDTEVVHAEGQNAQYDFPHQDKPVSAGDKAANEQADRAATRLGEAQAIADAQGVPVEDVLDRMSEEPPQGADAYDIKVAKEAREARDLYQRQTADAQAAAEGDVPLDGATGQPAEGAPTAPPVADAPEAPSAAAPDAQAPDAPEAPAGHQQADANAANTQSADSQPADAQADAAADAQASWQEMQDAINRVNERVAKEAADAAAEAKGPDAKANDTPQADAQDTPKDQAKEPWQWKTDYYEALGVSKDATADEIKSAYRRAARESHPDAGGDATQFDNMAKAYEVLSDEAKRREYDMFNKWEEEFAKANKGPSGSHHGTPGTGGDTPRAHSGTGGGWDFDDDFDDVFAGMGSRSGNGSGSSHMPQWEYGDTFDVGEGEGFYFAHKFNTGSKYTFDIHEDGADIFFAPPPPPADYFKMNGGQKNAWDDLVRDLATDIPKTRDDWLRRYDEIWAERRRDMTGSAMPEYAHTITESIFRRRFRPTRQGTSRIRHGNETPEGQPVRNMKDGPLNSKEKKYEEAHSRVQNNKAKKLELETRLKQAEQNKKRYSETQILAMKFELARVKFELARDRMTRLMTNPVLALLEEAIEAGTHPKNPSESAAAMTPSGSR